MKSILVHKVQRVIVALLLPVLLMPVLPPVSNIGSCTKISEHRQDVAGIIAILFRHVDTPQCDGALRNYRFAEWLGAEICHVLLTLDSAYNQHLGPDPNLYPRICHIHVFQKRRITCMWRMCAVAFASTASTGVITYPRSHSNDTTPFDPDSPNAAANNSDSALLLAIVCCERVYALNV